MKNAIIYTRVSTAEQVHGTSLDSQLLACQNIANLRELVVVSHEQDAGISGAKADRPGLARALAAIVEGKADTLIVYRLDRVGRTVRGIIDVAEQLDRRGVPILTCDGMEFGATLTGRFIMHQFAAIAELERGMIRERCGRGRAARASQGVQPSSAWSPFGYHIPTKPEVMAGRYSQDELGLYLVQPNEAAVVMLLYQRIAEGSSLRSLCADLASRGVAAPRGGQWQPGSLGRMLRQPLYRGEASWKGIPIACPAIVPAELWQNAQERLDAGRWLGGPRQRRYLLSGLIRCPECGTRMAAAVNDGHRYYRCQKARNRGECSWRLSLRESDVLEALRCILSAGISNLAQAAFDAHAIWQARQAAPSDQERHELELELGKLERDRLEAIRLQISAPISARGTYTQVIEEISQRELLLRTRLERIARPKSGGSGSMIELLSRLPQMIEGILSREDIPAVERGRVIGMLFPRIVAHEDGFTFECVGDGSVLRIRTRKTDSRGQYSADAPKYSVSVEVD